MSKIQGRVSDGLDPMQWTTMVYKCLYSCFEDSGSKDGDEML